MEAQQSKLPNINVVTHGGKPAKGGKEEKAHHDKPEHGGKPNAKGADHAHQQKHADKSAGGAKHAAQAYGPAGVAKWPAEAHDEGEFKYASGSFVAPLIAHYAAASRTANGGTSLTGTDLCTSRRFGLKIFAK